MSTLSRRRLLTLAAAAPVLAACGTTAAEAPSFRYWSMWHENEPQAHVLAQAIADFKRDTGITVDVR